MEKEHEISLLQEKVRNRETSIGELHNYVRHFKKTICDQDLKI